MKCVYCKNEIPDNAIYCPFCGSRIVGGNESVTNNSTPTHKHVRKSGIVYLLLALFFGGLGIHRFYVRDIKVGVFYLLGTLFMVTTIVPVFPTTVFIIPVIAAIDGIMYVNDEQLYEKFNKYW